MLHPVQSMCLYLDLAGEAKAKFPPPQYIGFSQREAWVQHELVLNDA